ncbi:MAG: hypothetical protein RM338_18960 [Nostoc sp. DedQUE12a]|nr:hypothetical protein [Nostoc sp. DedQUE12a]
MSEERLAKHLRSLGVNLDSLLPENRFWLEELELGLGLCQDTYQQTTLLVVALV